MENVFRKFNNISTNKINYKLKSNVHMFVSFRTKIPSKYIQIRKKKIIISNKFSSYKDLISTNILWFYLNTIFVFSNSSFTE